MQEAPATNGTDFAAAKETTDWHAAETRSNQIGIVINDSVETLAPPKARK
jgi:hypothetical protein